eukprot:TRINITY_DN3516_c0_g2_i1.p1 TRINITY_DN3516_c0_g2~~TRINITY_DN3516_c0_g2_i1.p1  ORF type:complete len:587 (-),score=47.04 TRINITY_DN3516_c0_g2_i1:1229-2863(-)
MQPQQRWYMRPQMQRIVAIWIVQVCQAIQVTMPLTIGVYMVRNFLGPEAAESKVSLLTGVLGAQYTLSQFFTAYLWGKISDRIGRKIVLQIGNISCMMSILLLGIAPTYYLACLSRFVGGLFNGVIGAEKTIIGESFTKQEQTVVLGVLSFGWGMGCIVGPSFGGLLSEPCNTSFGESLGGCGEGGILRRQPFLLPCVMGALFQVISITCAGFFIQETNKRSLSRGNSRVSYRQLDEEETGQESDIDQINELELVQLQREQPIAFNDKKPSDLRVAFSSSSSSSDEIPTVLAKPTEDEVKETQNLLPFKPTSTHSNKNTSEINSDDQLESDEPFIPWYKIQNVRISIMGYGLIALIGNIQDETIPIFASTPVQHGGLGIKASTLAKPLMISGVVLMINALFIIPKVTKNLGILKSAKLSLYVAAPLAMILPLSSLFVQSGVVFAIIVLSIGLIFRTICLSFTFTCSMVMVNGSSPPDQLGSVNGVGQTFGSFARGVGPFIGGMLWAISLHMPIPGHQFFVFIVTSGIMICTALLYNKFQASEDI